MSNDIVPIVIVFGSVEIMIGLSTVNALRNGRVGTAFIKRRLVYDASMLREPPEMLERATKPFWYWIAITARIVAMTVVAAVLTKFALIPLLFGSSD